MSQSAERLPQSLKAEVLRLYMREGLMLSPIARAVQLREIDVLEIIKEAGREESWPGPSD